MYTKVAFSMVMFKSTLNTELSDNLSWGIVFVKEPTCDFYIFLSDEILRRVSSDFSELIELGENFPGML